MSRRTLLQGTSMAALGAAMAPRLAAGQATPVQSTPTVNIEGTSLSILQWQHFVPQYDEWFPTFLQEWGDANGVEVSVDRINTADIPAALAGEISAESGHDLIEHIASLPQFEPSLVDMTDLVMEASNRHGEQLPMCATNSYNPTTDVFYGFCHGYASDPANYRLSLWDAIGLPDGPTTFDELLEGGTQIREEQGVQMGIGMSQEIDSNMAAQAMLWAFGASVQDENENVTINSPETLAAVDYMTQLFNSTMTAEVFAWNAASNNQLLVAGQASYILNSISAYRTAQGSQPDVAADIFFLAPLEGPAGAERALAHGHAVFQYMMPQHSPNQDTAREFLLHLIANYAAACNESQLYNFPAWGSTVPDLYAEGGWLDNDPFGSEPADKLAILKTSNDWTVNLGWPGPANALIGEVFNTFVLSNMMARAARGDQSPEESVAQAEEEINAIAENWRNEGLIGGGS